MNRVSNDQPPQRLLTPAEVAEILGISVSTVYDYLAHGILPCVRFGKHVRIPPEEFARWLQAHTQVAAPA